MSKAGDVSSSTADDGNQNSGMKAAAIVVTVIAVLVLALLLMALVKRRSSASSHYLVDQYSQNRSSTPLVDNGTYGFCYASSLESLYCLISYNCHYMSSLFSRSYT